MAHPYHQHREHQVSHRRVGPALKDHPPGATKLATGSAFSAVTSKSAANDHDADDRGSRSVPKRFARGGKVKKADGGATAGLPRFWDGKPYQGLAGDLKDNADAAKMDLGSAMNNKSRENTERDNAGKGKYARGGKVKHGHQTNIAIVVPHRGAQQPMAGAPPAMAGAPMPGGPPMAGPAPGPGAGNPPGLPQGMPMHKRGGVVKKAGGGAIGGEATKGNLEKWSKRASGNSYFRGGAASGVGREEKAASEKRHK